MNINKITKEDFEAYESTRKSGLFNMFDPNARRVAGLDKYTYAGVMEHYTELCEKYPGVKE